MYIDLLTNWELIRYNTHIKDGGNIGKYKTYSITQVKNESPILNERFNNLKSEMTAVSELTEDDEKTIAKYLS